MGEAVTEDQLHEILSEVDLNKNGQVDLGEFLQVGGVFFLSARCLLGTSSWELMLSFSGSCISVWILSSTVIWQFRTEVGMIPEN